MKIYSTNRINALGLNGPEKAPEKLRKTLNLPIEQIEVNNENISESENILYKKAKEIFSKDEKQVFIGGDHSITYPLFNAFRESKKEPFLIVFDAHADSDIPTNEPTHEEWLRKTVEEGFSGEDIILIGLRKTWKEEEKFLIENKIKLFRNNPNIEDISKYIKERTKGKDIYLSIDVDVIDPKYAPAVNYKEKGGITPKELIKIIELISVNLNTVDIVEFIPKKDIENKTENLIADLIKKIRTNS